jgi:hypothetical protein
MPARSRAGIRLSKPSTDRIPALLAIPRRRNPSRPPDATPPAGRDEPATGRSAHPGVGRRHSRLGPVCRALGDDLDGLSARSEPTTAPRGSRARPPRLETLPGRPERTQRADNRTVGVWGLGPQVGDAARTARAHAASRQPHRGGLGGSAPRLETLPGRPERMQRADNRTVGVWGLGPQASMRGARSALSADTIGRRRASCRARTDDLPFTRRVLWPTELRRQRTSA